MELSLPQRADSILASDVDKDEAVQSAKFALVSALNGESGKMVAIKRLCNNPYEIEYVLSDVSLIANKEKKIPSSWIVDDTRLSMSFRDYVRPLVQSETHIVYNNGVFETAHLRLSKVK